MKYHIEKNTVQETLVIPLFARKICSESFPDLFQDPEAERLCGEIDYDFSAKERMMRSQAGLFGALEVAQRQYDLAWEAARYLESHPEAAVVNLGCGLDNTFRRVDNGRCTGYNLDFSDVIEVRDSLLPAGEREKSLSCDLNDFRWFNLIDASKGAVFFASGVFCYFRTEEVRALFTAMAEHFPGAIIVFDACNRSGARMMTKTWLKEAGITDVEAYFALDDIALIRDWSSRFSSVSARSYMNGYRDIRKKIGLLHRILCNLCDSVFKMQIVRLAFSED